MYLPQKYPDFSNSVLQMQEGRFQEIIWKMWELEKKAKQL